MVRRAEDFRWEGVDLLPYKEDGNLFRSVTRQVLLRSDRDLDVELRYFEVGPGGHSTLERHQHQHAVVILRGGGHVLVGETINEIALNDVVQIPPCTWHQFRATGDEPLGFLCVVANDRDKPQRATPEDLEAFSEPVRAFVRA